MIALLDEAVERLRRERFFERVDAEWAAIMADPQARAEVEAEQALWDQTLMDGLEDEEDW